MERRIIIFSHGEDVDGLISATILSKRFESEAALSYWFFSFPDVEEKFDSMLENQVLGEQNILIISDLSLSQELACSVLPKLSSRFDRIFWLDHHMDTFRNSFGTYLSNVEFVIPWGRKNKWEEACSAVLAFRHFVKRDGDDFLEHLSRVAQASDYSHHFKSDAPELEYAKKLQKIITLINSNNLTDLILPALVWDLKQVLDIFGESCDNSVIYCSLLTRFKYLEQEALRELTGSVRRISLWQEGEENEARYFLFGQASSILPAKETLQMIRETYSGKGWDGFIVAFGPPTNNVLVFKDPQSDFDASEFCSYMGGGGRGGDGGFSIDPDIPQNKIFNSVGLSLRRYFERA